LHQLHGPDTTDMAAHRDRVWCLRFDDSEIITGSMDQSVKIWDWNTGQHLHTTKTKEGTIRYIQFDKSKLVTASAGKMIRIWDMNTYKSTALLKGHTSGVWCLQYTGTKLVSGSFKELFVWDLRILKTVFTCKTESHINELHFDDKKIVAVTAAPKILVHKWDTDATFHQSYALRGHTIATRTLSFQDNILATSGSDGTVRFWDFARPQEPTLEESHKNSRDFLS